MLVSGTDNSRVVKIFTARACAKPLEDAARIFENETGIAVEISMCGRHCVPGEAEEATAQGGSDDFLTEIADMAIHDLAIGGAEYLLDDGEVRGIIRKGERRLIACRVSALIVPAGNPLGIRTLSDVAQPGVRVAVSVLDCLKGLWEDVCARQGLLDAVRRNIVFHANGCVAIIEAVAQKKVDVGFGWSAFRHLDPDRIEIISLPGDQVVQRGTGVGMLAFCKDPELARQFMDFLTTLSARSCYYKYGWVECRGRGQENTCAANK